jgi:TolB-like protein
MALERSFFMKNIVLGVIPLLILIMGCGSSPSSIAGKTLDNALVAASAEIDGTLAANTIIAFVNFNSTDKFSAYVLDELTANLVKSKHLIVIDRTEIDIRRNELNFQMSGEVSDESMQSLGRTLGAQSIITGSLTELSGQYRIVIRVLNVETGRVEVMYRDNIRIDATTSALLRR